MAQVAFPSGPVKDKLRNCGNDPLGFFREVLAEDLPPENMYASAFVLRARLILAAPSGRMAGYPPAIYVMIENDLERLVRETLPADRVAEAVEMIERT